MNAYKLKTAEFPIVDSLLSKAYALQSSVDQDTFIDEVSILSQRLPNRLLRKLTEFRLKERGSPVLVISGLPICDEGIGPTPPHRNVSIGNPMETRESIFLMLCGSVIGDPIAWATQQGGKLVHDIHPIKELGHLQTSASSDITLEWHTEEAFHELRPDYIGMLCLRNPSGTATTVGRFDPAWMAEQDIDFLFQSRFQIRPDDSHLIIPEEQDISEHIDRDLLEQSYKAMSERDQEPRLIPVLSGSREDPFICIDPAYMRHSEGNTQSGDALRRTIEAINDHMEDLVLQPGDVVFINNEKAVHGRKPFNCHHDGTDRWLKRISLTRDLSKSRHARTGGSRRIIY